MSRPLFCLALLGISTLSFAADEVPWVIGPAQLYRLDLLPAFKRTVKVGSVTSYDRTGGNDDGFSGKYSFVRKEGDNLVLADLVGPGCLYRLHTPTPTDDVLDFYFDGEPSPRISLPFRELYSGKTNPFVKPLVDYAGGGFTCYLPIPYKKSLKILLHAKSFQFYDLNYATYPSDAPIQSFSGDLVASDLRSIREVFAGGRDSDQTAHNVPAGTKLTKARFDKTLEPGKSVTLFETKKGGRIADMRIGPADAFVGKQRDILLRVTWDNDKLPAIMCPAGDFFGYAWGKPATGSCLIGTHNGTNYCNLPMPFDHAAKIELVSVRSSGPAVSIKGEVTVGDTPRKPYEGKFYAVWRRENPTTDGKPFTFLDTQGRGQIVGLALQAQGMESGNTGFFEGDDVTTIDGEMAIHGTGSEDFFNGGWYDVPDRWDAPVARALSGCMAYQKPLGRTGAYRFFLGDTYTFKQSILQTIEHAGERNEGQTDYCAVTYLYSERRPQADFSVPSEAMRTVTDPKRIIFSADWTLPISSFSFADATLSRTAVPAGKDRARCLSMRARGGGDFFGPPFLSVICDLPASGRYKVYMNAVKGPDQAQVQLFRDESPVGDSVDLYSANPEVANDLYLGEISAIEGQNRIMLKLVGKNAAAKAYGLDLMNLIFVRA